jgi:hypothetical protein
MIISKKKGAAISNYLILLLVAGIDTLFAKLSTGKYVSGSL